MNITIPQNSVKTIFNKTLDYTKDLAKKSAIAYCTAYAISPHLNTNSLTSHQVGMTYAVNRAMISVLSDAINVAAKCILPNDNLDVRSGLLSSIILMKSMPWIRKNISDSEHILNIYYIPTDAYITILLSNVATEILFDSLTKKSESTEKHRNQ